MGIRAYHLLTSTCSCSLERIGSDPEQHPGVADRKNNVSFSDRPRACAAVHQRSTTRPSDPQQSAGGKSHGTAWQAARGRWRAPPADRRDVATQSLEAVTLMGLAGDGGVEREAILIGRERFRGGVRPGEARVLQGQRSAPGFRPEGNAVANGCRSQAVDGVGGLQVEPGLFGIDDEPSVTGEPSSGNGSKPAGGSRRACAAARGSSAPIGAPVHAG